MIYQLVYVSKATSDIPADELDQLLRDARTNNAQLDITGMLLYHDGSFIQVLEGDEQKVTRVFEKIERDPRHENTNVVLKTTVAERAFNDWAMGYRRTAALSDVPEGFHSFLQIGYRRQTELDNEAARRTLVAFREGRWRL